jgi:hypothetical protein
MKLNKKQQKVVNGMNQSTQKKFKTLFTTLTKGITLHDLKESYDVKEMWIRDYAGQGIYRVKFDYRFRAMVQVQPTGVVEFVEVQSREGLLK